MTGGELWDKLARGAKSDVQLDDAAREEIEGAEFE
jgi:hypothetical protein